MIIYVSKAVLPWELSTDQVLSYILSYPALHVFLLRGGERDDFHLYFMYEEAEAP